MTYMHKFKETANRHVNSSFEMDEVIAITLEFFLATADDKIISIYDKDGIQGCVKYICKTIATQATSTRSRYYYKTRRDNVERITDIESYKSYVDESGNLVRPLENLTIADTDNTTASLLTELDVILEEDIPYYLAQLFRMNKLEGLSMTKIAEKTNIGRNEVFNSITKATKQIKLAAFMREQKSKKLNDFGVLSQEEYNTKYRINPMPDDFIPKQLILDMLEDNNYDLVTVADRMNVPYGRLNRYINKYQIKL